MFKVVWTTKKTSRTYENFGLGGSGKTFFQIDPAVMRELQEASKMLGISFEKALKGVGYELYGMAKQGIRTQGKSLDYAWARKKQTKRFDRYWRLVQGNDGNLTRVEQKPISQYRSKYKDSEKSIESGELFGKVRRALCYEQKGLKVRVGAVSKQARPFLAAVQAGKRGDKYKFQYRNNQPITPKMRRLFFAMGIPLPKSKRTLQQPKRPLIYPLYRKTYPHLKEMVVKRMKHELTRKRNKQ